jgi:hypothetical protein
MKSLFEQKFKPSITFKAFDLNFMDEEFANIAVGEMLALL